MGTSTTPDKGGDAIRVQCGQPLCACPHWDPQKRACLLVREGLYLPVEQHVTTFCLTSCFATCHHYLRLLETGADTNGRHSSGLKRRRYIRIPSRHVFRFSEISPNDEVPGRSQNDAWTVDLGAGGLRFVCRMPLALQTTIRFCLEGDAAIASLTGTGRVAWCEPLENTALFHTGLAFIERSVSETSSGHPDF
ncbi:PilZ domain-containing protein [Desulfobulbus alkaliphilus]|uniref:PilZ domain-containing protein n=1 Tax=Desulfobulbus alkaliphilus TaxID=869814 RepID=UPI0019632108|nr:PilZ domain-containing protein [Desulfobulbus alkaliphilus]